MPSTFCHVLIGLLLSALPSPEAAPHKAATERRLIPQVVASARPNAQYPLWISADAAFDAEGKLRADRFTVTDRQILEKNLSRNAGTECKVFTGRPSEDYAPANTFDDVIGNALTIIAGDVTETNEGFFTGQPGTLLAVRITQRLKTFGPAASDDLLYVFLQDAIIRTKHGLICASTFSSVPTPAVGDHIVVFAYAEPIDQNASILDVDARTRIVVERAGELYAPSFIRKRLAAPATFDDLLHAILQNEKLHNIPNRALR